MAIENKTNLFGTGFVSKSLNDTQAPKAFKDQNAYEMNKILTSGKQKETTDQAQISATVSTKAKATVAASKADNGKTAHPLQKANTPAKSWQDQMGKDAVETGKILYGLDAKNYASKADYNKAVDEAIAQRDAKLKGDTAAQQPVADKGLTVAEGPNTGKPAAMATGNQATQDATLKPAAAEMANSARSTDQQPAQTTVNDQTIAQARAITDKYFKDPNSVSPEEYKWATQVQTQDPGSPITNMPGSATAQAANDPGIDTAAQQFFREPAGPQQYASNGEPQSGGFLSNMSKPLVGLLAAGLGGLIGYQLGQNNNDTGSGYDGFGQDVGYYDA